MPRSFVDTFRVDLRQMMPFHAFVLAYTAIVLAIAAMYGALGLNAYIQYVTQLAPLYFVILPATLAVAHVALSILRSGQPPHAALSPGALLGRTVSAAITLGMLVLFLGSFTTFKGLMPVLAGGFPHDRLLADIDAFLHGGVDPGPALTALVGYPFVLQGLQWNYAVVWTALTIVPAFFIAVRPEAHAVRLRYFLCFALVWAVLGNLIAFGLLSAGPIFYAGVTGDAARFGGQMAVLGEHIDSRISAYLWQSYVHGSVGIGTGISAFPSVHVGAAMMNALFLRETGRLVGFLAFAYVAVIAVSAVLLGWHYAIDGYVSVLVVWLLHRAVKRLLGARSRVEDDVTASPSPATP